MKITWLISESAPTNLQLPENIATSWGSWKTHALYKTENCVCSNTAAADKLAQQAFQLRCNFYIMQSSYETIGQPIGVKLFNGRFSSDNISNKDDIVALNLAVLQYDLVLMVGFDFSPTVDASRDEYYFNVIEIIKANEQTQFVLVDYQLSLDSRLLALDNITQDTVDNVMSLLG